MADDIRQCDELVSMMLFWTFHDVFEEDGPVKEPYYGGFGLIAAGGIKKPSFHAYALLHKLGHERIPNSAPNVLVTRNSDGTLVLAVWNLVDPDKNGEPRSIHLNFRGLKTEMQAQITRLDAQSGNSRASYEAMGKPRYPTQEQVKRLNLGAELPAPEVRSLENEALQLDLPVNGLAVLEIH